MPAKTKTKNRNYGGSSRIEQNEEHGCSTRIERNEKRGERKTGGLLEWDAIKRAIEVSHAASLQS